MSISKDIYSDFKGFIKYRFIRTQYEWQSHIDNVFRVFNKNIGTYNPDNLLDVGCGGGDRTIRIANHFNINRSNTYGVDYDDQHVIACKKRFNAMKIDLETDDLPYEDDTFELVVCN